MTMEVLRSFFKAMSKVPHFKVDGYQIVDHVYCDAEIRETGPTIIVYRLGTISKQKRLNVIILGSLPLTQKF